MADIILVIGSLNVDLVTYTDRVPNAGETTTSAQFSIGCGGKGANQAVAAARMAGLTTFKSSETSSASHPIHVQMAGSVGNDEFGIKILKEIEEQGVDTQFVETTSFQPTGTAVIVVETASGQNRILVYPGANGTVSPSHVPFPLPTSHNVKMIIMQLEISLDTVLDILQIVAHPSSTQRIPVLFNPSPAVALPDWAYSHVEVLVVNETEAAQLSGIVFPTSTLCSVQEKEALISTAYDAVHWFIKKGCRYAIVTLGAEGAVYGCRRMGNADSYPELGHRGHVPGMKVPVVDTTAAGDTFMGALGVSLLENWSHMQQSGRSAEEEEQIILMSVQSAVKAASWTVTKQGTWNAMPTRRDIENS